jgi:hypothetical protein
MRGAGRAAAGTACGRSCITNWARFVPVAEALLRLAPNSDSRLILLIRHANDQGSYLGYIRLAGRRNGRAKLADLIVSVLAE